MKPKLAIATGDPAGIGPEISIKAAREPAVLALCRPVLIGDRGALETHAKACGSSLDGLEVVERKAEAVHVGEVRPAHGRATLDAAEAAIRGALAGDYEAVVAAPHTEAAIHAAGVAFDGYPSFVARCTGVSAEQAILMLCFGYAGREIRIAHVTLHASVRAALEMITPVRVQRTLKVVHSALQRIGIAKPKIAVSGLNPHAGEGGAFGTEELDSIAPAIECVRREGVLADGPIGADTLLARKDYDAYVVMLHDQGHVAAKLLAPNGSAAVTIGTPVLFSSVGHGSALGIAGKGVADHRAMVEAITRLVGHRRRGDAT